ncbi:hypothetical protein WA158_002032 [Blastocystis sp. Blastoise]
MSGIIASKLKILCFHGYLMDATSMAKTMEPIVRQLSDIATFSYLDGLIPLTVENKFRSQDDPNIYITRRTWYKFENDTYFEFDKTLDYIKNYLKNSESYDGILGFSQGGIIASTLVALQQKGEIKTNFKFVISVGSSLPKDMNVRNQVFGDMQLLLPSLHIYGKTDKVVVPERSQILISRYKNPTVFTHDFGHYIPRHPAAIQAYRNFHEDINSISIDFVQMHNTCSAMNTSCPLAQYYSGSIGESKIIYNKKTETKGTFIVYNNDTLILSLRGTETLTQCFYDVLAGFFTTVPYLDSSMKIGLGYHLSYESVKDQSLGGSLAALAAIEMWMTHGIYINGIYSFGSPRVGNKPFSDFFNLQILVNNEDPVPHFPFLYQGFRHMGIEIWINLDNSIRNICTPSISIDSHTHVDPATNQFIYTEDPVPSINQCSEPNFIKGNADHVTYLNSLIFDCLSHP